MTTRVFSHELESDELAKRIKAVMADVQEEYEAMISDLTGEWASDNSGVVKFSMMGSSIWITFENNDGELSVETNSPFPQVMSVITPKLETALR